MWDAITVWVALKLYSMVNIVDEHNGTKPESHLGEREAQEITEYFIFLT